jgi:hypothetical protein
MTLQEDSNLGRFVQEIAGKEMVPSYFAAFPESRDVNPASWDAKLKFWKSILTTTFQNKRALSSTFSFHAEQLPSLFAIDGIAPRGLPKVLVQVFL